MIECGNFNEIQIPGGETESGYIRRAKKSSENQMLAVEDPIDNMFYGTQVHILF